MQEPIIVIIILLSIFLIGSVYLLISFGKDVGNKENENEKEEEEDIKIEVKNNTNKKVDENYLINNAIYILILPVAILAPLMKELFGFRLGTFFFIIIVIYIIIVSIFSSKSKNTTEIKNDTQNPKKSEKQKKIKALDYEKTGYSESDLVKELLYFIKEYKEFHKGFFEDSHLSTLFRNVDYTGYIEKLKSLVFNSNNLNNYISKEFEGNIDLVDSFKIPIKVFVNLNEVTIYILTNLLNKENGKKSFSFSEMQKAMNKKDKQYKLCLNIEKILFGMLFQYTELQNDILKTQKNIEKYLQEELK